MLCIGRAGYGKREPEGCCRIAEIDFATLANVGQQRVGVSFANRHQIQFLIRIDQVTGVRRQRVPRFFRIEFQCGVAGPGEYAQQQR